MLPDFIIIGAPKSGTSSLYTNLSQHPQICMASHRELHYFDSLYDKGLEWYKKHFAHCKEGVLVGEKTGGYFIRPQCAPRIKQLLPEVKLIVQLRNPIDIAYSLYAAWVRLGRIPVGMSFMKSWEAFPGLLEIGKHADHLEHYLSYFKREKIHVSFLDDLKAEPQLVYSSIFKFLRVEPTTPIEDTIQNVSQPIYAWQGKALDSKTVDKLQKRLPKFLLNKLLARFEYKLQPMTEEERKYLRVYYRSNNERLFNLLGTRQEWK